jgi:hypothetical protein
MAQKKTQPDPTNPSMWPLRTPDEKADDGSADTSAWVDEILARASAVLHQTDPHVQREELLDLLRQILSHPSQRPVSLAKDAASDGPDGHTARILVELALVLSRRGKKGGAHFLAELMVSLSYSLETNLVEKIICAVKLAIADEKELDRRSLPIRALKSASRQPTSRLETLLNRLFEGYEPGWEAALRQLRHTGLPSSISHVVAKRMSSWKSSDVGLQLSEEFAKLLHPLQISEERKRALLTYVQLALVAYIGGSLSSAQASVGYHAAKSSVQAATRGVGVKVGVALCVSVVAAAGAVLFLHGRPVTQGGLTNPAQERGIAPAISQERVSPVAQAKQDSPVPAPEEARDGLALYDERDRLIETGDRAFDAQRFSESLSYYVRALAIKISADALNGREKIVMNRQVPAILCGFVPRNSRCFGPYEGSTSREIVAGQDRYVEQRIALANLGEDALSGNPDRVAHLRHECEFVQGRKSPNGDGHGEPWNPFYLSLAVAVGDQETIVSCIRAEIARIHKSPLSQYLRASWEEMADSTIMQTALERASFTGDGRSVLAEICTRDPLSVLGSDLDRNVVPETLASMTKIRERACQLARQ